MALPKGRDGDVVFPVTETMDLYCMSLLIRLACGLKGQGHWLSFSVRKRLLGPSLRDLFDRNACHGRMEYNRKNKIVSNTKKKLIVCFSALLSIWSHSCQVSQELQESIRDQWSLRMKLITRRELTVQNT